MLAGFLRVQHQHVPASLAENEIHLVQEERAKLGLEPLAGAHLGTGALACAVRLHAEVALSRIHPDPVNVQAAPGAIREQHKRKRSLRQDRDEAAADRRMDARLLSARTQGNGGEPDPPDSPPVPIKDPPAKPQTEPPAPVREPGPTPPMKR